MRETAKLIFLSPSHSMEKINPKAPHSLPVSSTFLDPAALMRNVAFGLRVKVYWSAVSSLSQCVAELFADAAGGRWMRRSGGFASRLCAIIPRGASLRLGTPGLYSATPLGLVWGGVVEGKGAVVEQGVLARFVGFVSRACDWLGFGEQHEVNGRDRSAGIATRCECVCERDVRQRGVSLCSTPRYRLGWLRHPEMERGCGHWHRSKECQRTGLVTHLSRGEPPSGN